MNNKAAEQWVSGLKEFLEEHTRLIRVEQAAMAQSQEVQESWLSPLEAAGLRGLATELYQDLISLYRGVVDGEGREVLINRTAGTDRLLSRAAEFLRIESPR